MDRIKTIAALREIADLLEAHPELNGGYSDVDLLWSCDEKEELAAFARAVGKSTKTYVENYCRITHVTPCGGVLWASVRREKVCEKIITTKVLPPEPERTIPALPERVVECVEWKCGSILAAAD